MCSRGDETRYLCAFAAAAVLVDPMAPAVRAQHSGSGNDWLAYGGTSDEDHYSSLTQINDKNVASLGLKWFYDLPTMIDWRKHRS
jgi:quinohemoprotein ethanol dehydrogenase